LSLVVYETMAQTRQAHDHWLLKAMRIIFHSNLLTPNIFRRNVGPWGRVATLVEAYHAKRIAEALMSFHRAIQTAWWKHSTTVLSSLDSSSTVETNHIHPWGDSHIVRR
jgi:hypothetical protein